MNDMKVLKKARPVIDPRHLTPRITRINADHADRIALAAFVRVIRGLERPATRLLPLALLLLLVGLPACRNGMRDGARLKPLEKTEFFQDGRSQRPLVEGTVPRGLAVVNDEQEYLQTGKLKGQLGNTMPFPLTDEVLKRGQERFEIFCSPCHDRLGTGQGMIVQRGLARPPSYHIDRLRQAPLGHFVDVMTNGFGAMYSYAYRVPPRDRWAIAAYIRVLQLSQGTTVANVPENELQKLEETEEQ